MQKTDFMKEIEMTSTALYYVIEKIKQEFIGGYINNIQTIEGKNLTKIKIHKQKTKELIVSDKLLFIPEHSLPVSEKPHGLIKFLKKKLYNQKIHEINQDKNNRVVYFKLDNYYLIFELFSKSNIILTHLDFVIITSKQKEEWKDRTIVKNEKYLFPQNKNIKETKLEELDKETKDFDVKKTISYLVKEYNVYSGYLLGNTSKEIIHCAKQIYELKNPTIDIEETEQKKIVVVKEGNTQTDFFTQINKHYVLDIIINDKKEEKQKINKQEAIHEQQIQTKKEYQRKADELQKEGEMIYVYFQTIEKINQQISIARDKKITEKEIIAKLNDYFSKNQKELKIKEINLKEKSYILEILNN